MRRAKWWWRYVALKALPADQAWFWTEQWQAGEWEATEQLARGEGTIYDTPDAFLDALR